MKKYLPLILLAGFGSPVFADITHKMQSSIQLQTNAAATQVSRIGSTYSVSGSGVSTDVGGGGSPDLNVGGLGSLTDGVGQGSIATATHTAGTAFSFSQSFIEGDAIQTTAPSLGAISTCYNSSWWRKWYSNYRSIRNRISNRLNYDKKTSLLITSSTSKSC
jgi:hypothetical protein